MDAVQNPAALRTAEKLDEELRKIDWVKLYRVEGLALDRDGNYGKVQLAYEAMVDGIGTVYA